ncbi:hypothetical protein VTO73DRAFT_2659 [Trametes versicolor]
MPRFLNTMSGEFEWHDDPKDITYAILSHTWRSTEHGGEQSYQDIQTLQATVAGELQRQKAAVLGELKTLGIVKPTLIARMSSGKTLPWGSTHSSIMSHPQLSDKIRGVCKIARKAGFRLVWIDSCCIDKYNGAELPPAITSMYEWYMLSTICYVYLDDVHDSCDPDALRRAFCLSRWHSRGWTLQELVAPEHVVFMTRAWSVLGTKLGLASILAEVTGVNFDILTGAATVHSVSVAQRMSWAARRTTTQVEDAAYSLMGIFDVHIPPIYGEGTNAFLRLQEEIMRTIPDQSIFAWGNGCTLPSLTEYHVLRNSESYGADCPGLLASSPLSFMNCRNITPITPSHFASRLCLEEDEDVPPLLCVVTPQGIRLRLICVNLAEIPDVMEAIRNSRGTLCDGCLELDLAYTLALLQCEDEDGSIIALPLRQPREGARDGRGLFIGTHVQCSDQSCTRPFHTQDITVETTLAFGDRDRLAGGGGPQQTIHLRLSLTQQSMHPLDHPNIVKAQFSILNIVGIPSDTGPLVQSPHIPPIDPLTHLWKEAPVRQIGDTPSTYRPRSLTRAEFMVHSDTHGEEGTYMVRLLRAELSGYRSSDEYPSVGDSGVFWLSIDVSERYSFATAGSPSVISSSGATSDRCDPGTGTPPHHDSWTYGESELSSAPTDMLSASQFEPDNHAVSLLLSGGFDSEKYRRTFGTYRLHCNVVDWDTPCKPPAPSTELATEPIPIFRTSPSKTARCYPQVELRGGQPLASCLSPVRETRSGSEGVSERVENSDLTDTPRKLQDTFRCENDALRAQTSVMSSQIAELASKNAEVLLQNAMLSSQMAAMSAQMSAIIARLEDLTKPSGECEKDGDTDCKGVS